MNHGSSHWGSVEIGELEEKGSPLRSVLKAELLDTRAFVERIYADFTRAGRRAATARLVESHGDLPWFIAP